MTALPQDNYYSVEDYLAMERASEIRNQYVDGEIFAMTGASLKHNVIVANALASLHTQLRKGSCTVYPSDMRVKVVKTGLYTYPDISVVCGKPQLEDDHVDTLLNPIALIEVLSPSTEKFDRGETFQNYRKMDSLQDFLLIAQHEPRIEHFSRTEAKKWDFTDASELDSSIKIPSIECTLLLSDVYEKIDFDQEE